MSQPQLVATDLVIGESARWHERPPLVVELGHQFSRRTWRPREVDAGAYKHPVIHRLGPTVSYWWWPARGRGANDRICNP
jgi:hypothetical protein